MIWGESMKKVCVLLALVLLLSLSSSAWAEEDGWVEVIRMDGMSVVVLGNNTMMTVDNVFLTGAMPGFVLPKNLTTIGERAFEGIAAARVEISENVESIGPYAFADCENLRTVTIPASVTMIDETAFNGCEDVTIIGSGDAAQAIAEYYSFTFVDLEKPQEAPGPLMIPAPPLLPAVSLR